MTMAGKELTYLFKMENHQSIFSHLKAIVMVVVVVLSLVIAIGDKAREDKLSVIKDAMSTKGWNWRHLETISQALLSALERK
jgi:hypothetical protein